MLPLMTVSAAPSQNTARKASMNAFVSNSGPDAPAVVRTASSNSQARVSLRKMPTESCPTSLTARQCWLSAVVIS